MHAEPHPRSAWAIDQAHVQHYCSLHPQFHKHTLKAQPADQASADCANRCRTVADFGSNNRVYRMHSLQHIHPRASCALVCPLLSHPKTSALLLLPATCQPSNLSIHQQNSCGYGLERRARWRRRDFAVTTVHSSSGVTSASAADSVASSGPSLASSAMPHSASTS